VRWLPPSRELGFTVFRPQSSLRDQAPELGQETPLMDCIAEFLKHRQSTAKAWISSWQLARLEMSNEVGRRWRLMIYYTKDHP